MLAHEAEPSLGPRVQTLTRVLSAVELGSTGRRFLINASIQLKLDTRTGARQPEEDEKIRLGLRSKARNEKRRAILEGSAACLQSISGLEAFDPLPVALLRPVTVVLEKVVELTLIKLQRE